MIKQIKVSKSCVLLLPENGHESVSAEWFDAENWRSQSAIIGQSTGRNTAWFFRHDNTDYVLRHYYRGGLISKFANDGYFFQGILKTRCNQEICLLEHMCNLGLPVPRPVAARVNWSGLIYRADLITEKIEDASDCFHLLQQQALPNQQWHAIGKTIRAFHNQQIFHADLNIHNIMLDKNDKAWLIDFDRGEVKSGNSWKNQNLDRLLRSLRKEVDRSTSFYWQESDWQALKKGYESENS